jgi:hypothetical protein
LSLLDTKSGGMNPVVLADQLNGVIELGRLYALANGQYDFGSSAAVSSIGNIAPTASGNTFRPPAGEIWLINYVNVRMANPLQAGEEIVAAASIYNTALGTLVHTGTYARFAGGERGCFSFAQPVIIGPNYGVGLDIAGWVNGTANPFRFDGFLTRLKV